MLDFVFEDGGIKVKGFPLWLDSSSFRKDPAKTRRPLNFINHAHADHIGQHKCIICSEPTLGLLKLRQKVEEVIVLKFGEIHELAGFRISLHPAGHVLGSSQILIEKDGRRICYTGDFRLGGGLTTEICEPVKCDTLLMECTYGHQRYKFPSREELLSNISSFVEKCFDNSEIPVILAYSLGKAQEAIKLLEALGYGMVAHPRIWQICQVYEKFGTSFQMLTPFHGGPIGRRVVVYPPQKSTWEQLKRYGNIRTAILTGWAVESKGKTIYGADEGIAYSDHCDFDQLIETVFKCGASKILLHHGKADRFADFLQAKGFDAEPLIPPAQRKLFK